MSLDGLFQQFLKERRYIKNSSPNTIIFYEQSYKAFKRTVGECEALDRTILNNFILGLREAGTKPATVNVYIRGMNSFLGWLHKNEHTSEKLL